MVFSSLDDLGARIDDSRPRRDGGRHPDPAERRPRSVHGHAGAGFLPIPKKAAGGGVKDMVRISDARMSGTAYGTIVLHVAPEAAAAAAGAGARRATDPPERQERRLDLLVDEAELAAAEEGGQTRRV
jgi:dihydroxy-acid dehydratase